MHETPATRAPVTQACRACTATGPHVTFTAQENMFGSHERFEYLRCADCGSLQIVHVPDDLPRHYPRDYYSLAGGPQQRGTLKAFLRRHRNRYALEGHGWIGRMLESRMPYRELRSLARVEGLDRASRILDVGCGSGTLLDALAELGFHHLLGLEPFASADSVTPAGVTIQRRTLEACAGTWDLIMFHHSFEHLTDPASTLAEAVARLAPGGTCLLRMPVAASWACEHYGVHWVGLDAPRHLCVFSVEGVRRLAARQSLDVRDAVYDSTELQFWGSERYERGLSLFEAAGGTVKTPDLTPARRRELRRRADALNASQQGDEAAFYLARSRPSAAET